MDAEVLSNSDLERLGRMDSRFLIEYQKYRPLVTELVARFNLEQLVDLARRLPFAGTSAWIVMPKSLVAAPANAWRFDKWLASVLKRPSEHSVTDVAVYCAAASQHATSKMLEEVERLAQQQLSQLGAIKELLSLAQPSTLLMDAVKRGGQERLQQLEEMKDGRKQRGPQGQDPEPGETPGEAQEADRQAPG